MNGIIHEQSLQPLELRNRRAGKLIARLISSTIGRSVPNNDELVLKPIKDYLILSGPLQGMTEVYFTKNLE